MELKGTRSVATQVLTLYGQNLTSPRPFRLHLANLVPGSQTAAAMAQVLKGSEKWIGFETHPTDPARVFAPHQCVYLSPDAPELLHKVEPGVAYVVGGLVDRNRHPGASLRRARATSRARDHGFA